MAISIHSLTSQSRSSLSIAIQWLQCVARQLFYSKANQMFIDGVVVGTTLFMTYLIRFDGHLPSAYRSQFFLIIPCTILLYVAMNYIWGGYELVWHFIGYKDSATLARSLACVRWPAASCW